MKKVITALLIAVCLGMAMPAQAQLKWGVKGGLNVTKVTFDRDLYSSDNRTGFFIGPMVEFTLPVVGLGIDGALLYSQKDAKVETDTESAKGLDIPVNLKYTFGLGSTAGIYIAAGPDFFFDFSKDKDIANGKINKKNAQVGFNIGVGLKLINHLQIGANYNIPLGDSGDISVGNIVDNYKTKTIQVSLAYLF